MTKLKYTLSPDELISFEKKLVKAIDEGQGALHPTQMLAVFSNLIGKLTVEVGDYDLARDLIQTNVKLGMQIQLELKANVNKRSH